MVRQAADSPVCLGIAAFGACQHQVKHQEGQQNAQHADKLQQGSCGHIAVLFFLGGLNQAGKHNTNTQEIAEVREVNIEIPADQIDVVENTQAGNPAHHTQGTVYGLKNQLCGSVLSHKAFLSFS